jgi:hypothetical protein
MIIVPLSKVDNNRVHVSPFLPGREGKHKNFTVRVIRELKELVRRKLHSTDLKIMTYFGYYCLYLSKHSISETVYGSIPRYKEGKRYGEFPTQLDPSESISHSYQNFVLRRWTVYETIWRFSYTPSSVRKLSV